MTHLTLTASQTVGPFFHDCLMRDDASCDILSTDATEGTRIRVQGRVIDGDGAGVPDAVLEIWQANHHGRYNHPADRRDLPLDPSFTGYGRIATQADGTFRFTTIKPGRVPAPGGGLQAPHINVTIFTRGLLKHLTSRIYFPGDPANAEDAVLQSVPAQRRGTLVATAIAGGKGAIAWNVILQGPGETVFFDY